MIDGIIFDLDGTLIDSALDFDAMRREMGFEHQQPILETVQALNGTDAERCHAILQRHESEGAIRATILPGVEQFLSDLEQRQVRSAIVTRNSRTVAQQMLAKLPFRFDPIITREDGPVKPDPWAVHTICQSWGVPPASVVVIGDFWFDIACGKAAGARSVLYSAGVDATNLTDHAGADFVLPCFTRYPLFWQWLAKSA